MLWLRKKMLFDKHEVFPDIIAQATKRLNSTQSADCLLQTLSANSKSMEKKYANFVRFNEYQNSTKILRTAHERVFKVFMPNLRWNFVFSFVMSRKWRWINKVTLHKWEIFCRNRKQVNGIASPTVIQQNIVVASFRSSNCINDYSVLIRSFYHDCSFRYLPLNIFANV